MSIQRINNYLGVPLFTLIMLSLLGVPRVIAHDLSIIEEGSLVNSILVFAPIIIWIMYTNLKNIKKTFLSLLLIGFFLRDIFSSRSSNFMEHCLRYAYSIWGQLK